MFKVELAFVFVFGSYYYMYVYLYLSFHLYLGFAGRPGINFNEQTHQLTCDPYIIIPDATKSIVSLFNVGHSD